MRTIFATSVGVELQLWKEETFACDKFVGKSTVDHITHCAKTLLVGLGTPAACPGDPKVRPSRYEIGGYRTLTLLFRSSLLPTNIYK